jgi:hypothetical protein
MPLDVPGTVDWGKAVLAERLITTGELPPELDVELLG